MKHILFAVIFAGLMLTGCGGSHSATTPVSPVIQPTIPPSPIAPLPSVACWGDSLTTGNQDQSGITYPSVLAKLTKLDVYNGGVGGQGSDLIAARMLANTSKYGEITIVWAGRNNYSNQSQVLSDVASMVSALSSPKQFFVMSVLNGTLPGETKGGSNYYAILSLNKALAAAYPNNYLDIRTYLVSQYNPGNAADVIDEDGDTIPYSLRAVDLSGTLSGGVGAGDTQIQTSTPVYVGVVITIDSEMMLVSGSVTEIGGLYTATVTRGYASTTNSSHSAGATLTGVDSVHINGKAYTQVAQQIATRLKSSGYIAP